MKVGYRALGLCMSAGLFGVACSNGGTMSGDSSADGPAADVSTGSDATHGDVAAQDSGMDGGMDAVSGDTAATDAPATNDTSTGDASVGDGAASDGFAGDGGATSGSISRATATAVAPGAIVTGDTSQGTDVSSACDPNEGGQIYYSITVPAHSSVLVTVTPDATTGNDVDIRVLTACGALTCYNETGSFGGTAGVFGLSSPGATAVTYIVSVSNLQGIGTGTDTTFTLGVSTPTTVPYAGTSITAACDDMSAATVLTGSDQDDGTTVNAALPFTFVYFGTSVLGYTMTSNGFAQLWTDTTSVGDTNFGNITFPTGGGPVNGETGEMLGAVAPFWDDLVGTAIPADADAGAAAVTPVPSVETFGTAPTRHMTLQWQHYYFYDDQSADLTFQLKFFETTNVIEVHYCAMIEGTVMVTQASGDSATVGLQDLTATIGLDQVANTAGSVATGGGFQFTPSP